MGDILARKPSGGATRLHTGKGHRRFRRPRTPAATTSPGSRPTSVAERQDRPFLRHLPVKATFVGEDIPSPRASKLLLTSHACWGRALLAMAFL